MSGYTGQARARVKSCPGIPRTNLKPSPSTALAERAGTPSKPTDQDLFPYYLDCVAKVALSATKLDSIAFSRKCGQWAKIGQCENGHRFAVPIYCRKPYCPICWEIEWHKKIARLYPKAQQLLPAALVTIRSPNEIQVFFHNRRGRRRFIKLVIKALKSLGYRRGIIFIHFFGDDPTRYAFHLHVLVDGDWLEPEELDELCRKLRRLIYPESVLKRWGDSLIVNYRYKPTRGQVYQALEYCTRPTFTQFDDNEWLADSIRGEHTIRRWGKWDEPPKWHLDESPRKLQSLVTLEQGKCPICGKPIVWDKPVIPSAFIDFEGGTEITTGYYILPPIREPPSIPVTPPNLTELPDGDDRKRSNLVKRHGERVADILSQLDDYESY